MSIRLKTLLILVFTFILATAALLASADKIVLHRFKVLEEEQVKTDTKRVLSALDSRLKGLENITRDWSEWDDAFFYIKDPDSGFIEQNISEESFRTLNINILAFINTIPEIASVWTFDFNTEAYQSTSPSLIEHIKNSSPVLPFGKNSRGASKGFISVDDRFLIFASVPIRPSNLRGRSAGTLMMARFIDKEYIKDLSETTHLSIEISHLTSPELPPGLEVASIEKPRDQDISFSVLSKDRVAGYTTISDIYGNPLLALRVDTPRDMYHQGLKSFQMFLISLAVVALLTVLSSLYFIDRTILSRLWALNSQVKNIGVYALSNIRVGVKGKDEIAILSSAVNDMLDGLEGFHNQRLAIEKRQKNQNSILVELAKEPVVYEGKMDIAATKITETAAKGINNVKATSIWLISDEDEFTMTCLDRYEIKSGKHAGGTTLSKNEFKLFVEAVETGGISPFRHQGALLKKNNDDSSGSFTALLAPIHFDGRLKGMVIAEHASPELTWAADEKSFINSLSDFIVMAMYAGKKREMEQELERLAKHDALTKLPNRTLFFDRLQQAILRADRTGKRIALLFVDIDTFKNVNDTFDHSIGDAALQEIANRLAIVVRKSDTIARVGGDEFTIILESIPYTEDVGKVAEKIINVVSAPMNIEAHSFNVTCSIGISIYPENAITYQELVRTADNGMYMAKKKGRNQYCYFTSTDALADQL
ncbi:MAG: diguanylate cyclase [Desulfobacterales bacterium]|nr:diguanylate cyclase [Desulfobacterales bacterium]